MGARRRRRVLGLGTRPRTRSRWSSPRRTRSRVPHDRDGVGLPRRCSSTDSGPARAIATRSTATTCSPIRRRAPNPTACTATPRSIEPDFAWTDDRLARPSPRRLRDLRAARRHVHATRARSTPRSTRLDDAPRARHHRDRADAGRGVPRRPQLGLRRRVPVRGAVDATAAPTGCGAWSTPRTSRGLAVVLDVVYNHLGPEGNVLGEYGPYFTDRYRTPWGAALNFDGAGQRRGPPVLRRQRAPVGRRLPHRRAAARRRARDRRSDARIRSSNS